jgi:hypothetical protein
MKAKFYGFLAGYAVFLGMTILTNVVTRPAARVITAKVGVPQLGNLI